MKLVAFEQAEIDLLALLLMSEEDRAWKNAHGPNDLETVHSLRRLLLKLPTTGLTTAALKHHCKAKPVTCP